MQPALARGTGVSGEDRFRGEIIERLMCDFEVDLAAICAKHERPISQLAMALARLEDFERDGLVRRDGVGVMVTPQGRFLVRSVCAAFDAYLDADAQRHATAI